jgi:hypothetical protein
MNLTKAFCGLTGCLFAALLSGCVVVADSGSGLGSITVDLAIDGETSPTICDAPDINVDEIDWVLVDDLGDTVATKTTTCGDFVLTFDGVPEGRYEVEISLVSRNETVSDLYILTNIRVIEDTDIKVEGDFPFELIH